MDYKLIALDLDGTLLNDGGVISRKNLESVQKAHEIGIKVIVTTGRSFISAESYIRDLDIGDPTITYNGALIQRNAEILKKTALDTDLVYEIIKFLKDLDYAPIVYPSDNKKYYETLGSYTADFLEFSRGFEKELVRLPDITAVSWKDVLRISVITEKPDVLFLHSELKKRFGSKIRTVDTYFAEWRFWLFEILDRECSKSMGLKYLCGIYNIDQDQVIAVGDNHNDLDMLSWAGLGVAMKNGLESVIREADYVTRRDNNEDGVAEVIEKFILN